MQKWLMETPAQRLAVFSGKGEDESKVVQDSDNNDGFEHDRYDWLACNSSDSSSDTRPESTGSGQKAKKKGDAKDLSGLEALDAEECL